MHSQSSSKTVMHFIVITALLGARLISADYPSGGVGLEYCRTDSDCAGSRSCFTIPDDEFVNCTTTSFDCFCRHLDRQACSSSNECPPGERCFRQENVSEEDRTAKYCWSCRYNVKGIFYVDSDPTTCSNIWLGGYTGDICFSTYVGCASGRSCIEFLDDNTTETCSFETSPCYCWPPSLTTCSSSDDCENGERCAINAEGLQACFSCGRVEADDSFKALDKEAVCTTPRPSGTPNTIEDSSSSDTDVYPSNGVGLEFCRTNDNCAGSRTCYYTGVIPFVTCNETTPDCICRYSDRVECSSSAYCSPGERCYIQTDSDGSINNFCWSCRVQGYDDMEPLDIEPSSCKEVWLGNYTGDSCSTSYIGCANGRTCVEFQDDGSLSKCSGGTEPCYCWPQTLTECTSSSQCEDGERCARSSDDTTACFSCGRVEADKFLTALDDDAVCKTPLPNPTSSDVSASPTMSKEPIVSETDTASSTQGVTPSPSASVAPSMSETAAASSSADGSLLPVPSPFIAPCIAISHLSHLSMTDLVFSEHVRASILCNGAGSCATPGHMVIYRGQPMMMVTYCSIVGECAKRSGWVNSPRMSRFLRIPSHSKDLVFTALAARYQSTIEESLLQLLIFLRL